MNEPDISGILLSDKTMVKRIFTNIFSNILKYGDKGKVIDISCKKQGEKFEVLLSNSIKQEHSDIGGNNIGLRNVSRMMEMMDGEMHFSRSENQFCICLIFPLK